jgi:hypothetical protein
MTRETETPISNCLMCGKEVGRVSSFEGAAPKPGDLTVCIGCAAVHALDDRLAVRALTTAEIEEVCTTPELLARLGKVSSAIHFARAQAN